MTRPQPIIVVHGGAGDLASEDDRRLYLQGVTEGLARGVEALARHGARSAVREAVVYMESHTIMNAGIGAALAADGSVSLDAGFMDGATRRYGGVTGVSRCSNPVLLADLLMADGEYGRMLGPPGGDALAERLGLSVCAPADLITERALRLHRERQGSPSPVKGAPWLDTVGAVAVDGAGHVAAAVSTGGMSMKPVGRIGDSPVVGSGFWADDRSGACVTTGVGEAIMRQGMARRSVQLVGAGIGTAGSYAGTVVSCAGAREGAERAAGAAAYAALEELVDYAGDTRGASGLILVTSDGVAVLDHHSKEMSAGWARPGGEVVVHSVWRGS